MAYQDAHGLNKCSANTCETSMRAIVLAFDSVVVHGRFSLSALLNSQPETEVWQSADYCCLFCIGENWPHMVLRARPLRAFRLFFFDGFIREENSHFSFWFHALSNRWRSLHTFFIIWQEIIVFSTLLYQWWGYVAGRVKSIELLWSSGIFPMCRMFT